jgi:hypothetical protein
MNIFRILMSFKIDEFSGMKTNGSEKFFGGVLVEVMERLDG